MLRKKSKRCCKPWPWTHQRRIELGFLLPILGGIFLQSTHMRSISGRPMFPSWSSFSPRHSESISPARFLLMDSWRSPLLSDLLILSLESPSPSHRRTSYHSVKKMKHFCPQKWSPWPHCFILCSLLCIIIFLSSSCQQLWNIQAEGAL